MTVNGTTSGDDVRQEGRFEKAMERAADNLRTERERDEARKKRQFSLDEQRRSKK